jgi:hypothetical protein
LVIYLINQLKCGAKKENSSNITKNVLQEDEMNAKKSKLSIIFRIQQFLNN